MKPSTIVVKISLFRNLDFQMARNQEPQIKLLQAATDLSITKDIRRLWQLTPEQRASLEEHPEVTNYRDALQKYRDWINTELGGVRKVNADPSMTIFAKEYKDLQRGPAS